MKTKKARETRKARESRSPTILYECDDYTISEIPLNYMIIYHVLVENHKKQMVKLIPQKQYMPLYCTLDEVKVAAEDSVASYLKEYRENPESKKLL